VYRHAYVSKRPKELINPNQNQNRKKTKDANKEIFT
jgi:hypothetical protein